MTVHVRTISGKTISIKCDKRQSITRIKDEMIPKDLQHLVNQGRALSESKTVEESNINAETTLEMTLALHCGTKEDETMTSAGSGEDRQMRIKHSEISEIGGVQLSDDTEHMKKEMNNASMRSEEKMESLLRKFQMNPTERMEMVMKQSNEAILRPVGVQLQGTKRQFKK